MVSCEVCGDEFTGDTLDMPTEARDELPYAVVHREPEDEDMRALDAVEHVYLCSPDCIREYAEDVGGGE